MAGLPDNFADQVEHWTPLPAEVDLLAGKHDGATKLAFALVAVFIKAVRLDAAPRGGYPFDLPAVRALARQGGLEFATPAPAPGLRSQGLVGAPPPGAGAQYRRQPDERDQ